MVLIAITCDAGAGDLDSTCDATNPMNRLRRSLGFPAITENITY